MNENKADKGDVNETWDRVGKAVNEATDLYLKEVEAYLGWLQTARREMLEQTLAASQQLSRIGEAQFAFLGRMQRSFPFFGFVPTGTETKGRAA
jgi:hypothetical protein